MMARPTCRQCVIATINAVDRIFALIQVANPPLSTPNYGDLFFGRHPDVIDQYPNKMNTPADGSIVVDDMMVV